MLYYLKRVDNNGAQGDGEEQDLNYHQASRRKCWHVCDKENSEMLGRAHSGPRCQCNIHVVGLYQTLVLDYLT